MARRLRAQPAMALADRERVLTTRPRHRRAEDGRQIWGMTGHRCRARRAAVVGRSTPFVTARTKDRLLWRFWLLLVVAGGLRCQSANGLGRSWKWKAIGTVPFPPSSTMASECAPADSCADRSSQLGSAHLAGWLVLALTQINDMPKQTVSRPLGVADLNDHLRAHPMNPRQHQR
jgi:hypothetical protein